MLATLVTLAVKFGLGGIIDKTIALLDHRAELEVDKEKLRTELASEHLRQIVEETRLMVDFNDYPAVLLRMLNQCIREPHIQLAVFVMHPTGEARLDFIQVSTGCEWSVTNP